MNPDPAKTADWLSELIKINTENPPGNERRAVEYLASEFDALGIGYQIVSVEKTRPNIIAEIKGSNPDLSPLLLSSHLDTVPVGPVDSWTNPPLSGLNKDGEIWGRGALDVKYKTALDLSLLAQLKNNPPQRTVKMVALSDEETGGELGVKYITRNHRELVDAEYVINEVGGFPLYISSKPVVVIQTGEKGGYKLNCKFSGQAGHGSIPLENNSINNLSTFVANLTRSPFRHVICGTTAEFLNTLEKAFAGQPEGQLFSALADKLSCNSALEQIQHLELRAQLAAVLGDTVAPTGVEAGVSLNTLPEEANLILDCRIVPGSSVDSLIEDLQKLADSLGLTIYIDKLQGEQGYELGSGNPLLELCKDTTAKLWKEPVSSFLLPASSDNSQYYSAGITPIGFAPLLFEPDFPGFSLAHAPNERIPLKALEKGLQLYAATLSNWL